MADFAAERETLASKLRMVRWISLLVGVLNLGIVLLGGVLLDSVVSGCSAAAKLPVAAAALVAGVRVAAMVGAARAQHATAETIAGYLVDGSVAVDGALRRERRVRYKRWLWWTRFGMVVTVLQFVAAVYLMFIINDFAFNGNSKACFGGQDTAGQVWKQTILASFLVLVWVVVIMQCFTGSDILKWRSFYATHDTAWKAHYREVFDHAIREALCCLGRAKYLTVLEEDEVYSVARLLGDLVAYRASGTGHLELLAGLALLQSHRHSPSMLSELVEAPKELIQEAALYHPFAEAAYTGPLLDFGRNPILFPCAWLYRQGVLTPWTRNRRPVLEGDNWWRGHAAAFLKYVNLPPEALLRGRVCQMKREAAYFVVVLHDQRTVVIAVRGTETPEDLITDGLCRECELTLEDLDGLLSEHLPESTRQRIISSFPHYGHAGIVESARELFMQIDGQQGDKENSASGYLSSLLGVGCECHGYKVHIVGHSLGGAVATLLGLRLYGRYPNLHVYAYGTLPCLDFVLAEACSDFITTIVYNDEYSARLSVSSILRLRSAAITALSDDSSADSAMIRKLARRILHVNKYHENGDSHCILLPASITSNLVGDEKNHIHNRRQFEHTIRERGGPYQELNNEESLLHRNNNYQDQNFDQYDKTVQFGDPYCRFEGYQTTYRDIPVEPPEMFLPGLIIHIVRQPRSVLPLWKFWSIHDKDGSHRAFLAKRESFRDIVVTPYMFIDHLPWRCHYAMQRVLEAQKSQNSADLSIEQHLV
ncbi:sn1-specific diacylglycerol lipase beta isoform X1 [Ananas comosus]|uniref:Sn1-specific diacylglycerol lipase beta isoform X1 n=1 Tax=Ananas comosus TaxID=4615 RepID=A0A6P5H1J5_ANACO|nr:sn1-specific diacylglycerol lipase beta isoform X1 [Ananas comosus]